MQSARDISLYYSTMQQTVHFNTAPVSLTSFSSFSWRWNRGNCKIP